MSTGFTSISHLFDPETIAQAAMESALMAIDVYVHICDHPLLRDHWVTKNDGSALLDSTSRVLREAQTVLLAQTDPSSRDALEAYAAITEALLPLGRMMTQNGLFTKAAELPIVDRLTPRPGGALEKMENELRSLNQVSDPRFSLRHTSVFSLTDFVQHHRRGEDGHLDGAASRSDQADECF